MHTEVYNYYSLRIEDLVKMEREAAQKESPAVSLASESSDEDHVTTPDEPSPASTPATAPTNADPLSELDTDYDFLQDTDETVIPIVVPRDPYHIPRANMAADFSEGRLETIVDKPQKELPGTKDAYVSYQVTTKVSILFFSFKNQWLALETNVQCVVRLPVLPTSRVLRAPPLYRLRLPLETTIKRVPTMLYPAAARQAQDGVCAWRPVWAGLHTAESSLTAPLP